jgi:hypothetical protein
MYNLSMESLKPGRAAPEEVISIQWENGLDTYGKTAEKFIPKWLKDHRLQDPKDPYSDVFFLGEGKNPLDSARNSDPIEHLEVLRKEDGTPIKMHARFKKGPEIYITSGALENLLKMHDEITSEENVANEG